jgi:glucokinase
VTAACALALDVGGTVMKGALVDRDLRVLAELRRPTPRDRGPEAIVDAIAAALDALAARADEDGLKVHHAGVAVPGIVDEEAGRAVYSENLGWRDLPLAGMLTARTGLPVALGHDVRSGGRAEAAIGAAHGIRDVLFMPIGTGISCAAICDGQVISGAGYAGEIGHLCAEPDGAACPCGGRGCLETVASAAAIATRFTARTGRPAAGAAEVADWLDRGDRPARAVWDEAVAALAAALAVAVTLFAPELVVIGGGLAESGDRLLVPLREALSAQLTFQRRPRLVRAALGDRAGCLGAGLLAWAQPTARQTTEEAHAAHPDR